MSPLSNLSSSSPISQRIFGNAKKFGGVFDFQVLVELRHFASLQGVQDASKPYQRGLSSESMRLISSTLVLVKKHGRPGLDDANTGPLVYVDLLCASYLRWPGFTVVEGFCLAPVPLEPDFGP